MAGSNAKWKSGVIANQPITAAEYSAGIWILAGGTFKTKDKLEEAGARFNFGYHSHVFEGKELTPQLLNLVDFVIPLPQKQEDIPPVEDGHSGQYPKLSKWYRKPRNKQRLFTMYYKEPEPVPDFINPSWWDEYLFYLHAPQFYPAVAIVGPSGNGKTTGAIAAHTAMSIPFIVIDITEFVEPADLIGAMTYHPDHGTVWMDGSVSKAFRMGWNIIINEFDAANPRAALCLQSVFQDPGANNKGRYVTTPGNPETDRIYPEGPCTVTLTMNTYGTGASRMYTGRNTIDTATLDRMAFISTGYENEEEMLLSRGFKRKTASALVKWAKDVRKKIDDNALKLNISPRTLSRMAFYIENVTSKDSDGHTIKGTTLPDAINRQFLSRLDPEDRELLS